MSKKYIPIILGTGREGRQSEKVAKYMLELLQESGKAEFELIDCMDYISGRTIPDWHNDPKTKPWNDIAKKADAFIFVIPEYNHGYPGEFKMLIDQDGPNYRGKSVLLAGVSSGGFGGARVIEHIIPILNELGLIPLGHKLNFSKVEEEFKKEKQELDKKYQEKILEYTDYLINGEYK